jgi:hypothetical protein
VTAVWQISAGPSSRSYADVFLRHGVALIGPGDAGPWTAERRDEDFEGRFVRHFASTIASGDVIVLRTGRSRILAVGTVSGPYLHVEAFDDVNGWDLQHTRRVRWGRLPAGHDFGSPVFGANPPRCSRVGNSEVLDFARRFLESPPTRWQSEDLPELPTEHPPLEDLPSAIRGLVAQAADLVPLMWDPKRYGSRPSEDELIVHFVVPMLRAFGWPPERIAVKWRNVDVAVFRALPRVPETCCFVIEAKRLGAGVEGALEQAQGYVTSLGARCDVLVTDGSRYRLYDGAREFTPLAYANLIRLKAPAADLFARLQP